jgi:hypothetical protein
MAIVIDGTPGVGAAISTIRSISVQALLVFVPKAAILRIILFKIWEVFK